MRQLALAAVLVLGLAAPAGADFEAGVAAYERGDYATALKELQPVAEQGDAKAQSVIGFMYLLGRGVPKDPGAAVTWFRKAAEQGNAVAQFNLGSLYLFGQGVPQDPAEAVTWLRKAAEQGNANAQLNLGYMYHRGQGTAQDYAEAAKWYRQAAEQGNAYAQGSLGLMYYEGKGVPQDLVQAHMWYNIASWLLPPDESNKAVASRANVEGQMTPAQVAEAEKLAREWIEKHLKAG